MFMQEHANANAELFSASRKSKAELLSALNQENRELFYTKVDFVVVYSTACYDGDISGTEIHQALAFFSKQKNAKYKSYSFVSELYLLMFRPNLMTEQDFSLIKEAVTYFNFSNSSIYIGYAESANDDVENDYSSSPKGFNLP